MLLLFSNVEIRSLFDEVLIIICNSLFQNFLDYYRKVKKTYPAVRYIFDT